MAALMGVKTPHGSASTLAEFQNWLGSAGTVDTVLAYSDAAGPGWETGGYVAPAGFPVNWSLQMYPSDGGVAALQSVAAGNKDAEFTQWAEDILASRSGDTGPIYVRTAWELGGEWFPWTGDAQADPTAFKQAFAHMADAFHDVSPRFQMVWDTVGDRGDQTYLYPGDAYVDVVSEDLYWQRQFQSQDPLVAFDQGINAEFGLNWLAGFAATHGKDLAVPEWGAQGDDAGPWIDAMDTWIDTHDVAYANYWNDGPESGYDGMMSDGRWPNAGAELKEAFGDRGTGTGGGTGGTGGGTGGGDPGPGGGSGFEVGTGPDTIVLQVSEDEFQGHAQFNVWVDSTQVAGPFTTTAVHGSATDTVTIHGDFADGEHTIFLEFLNDAGGTPGADRNLYIDGATYNGAAVSGAAQAIYSWGGFFDVTDTTPIGTGGGTGGGGTPTYDTPATLQAGTGPDALVLKISETEYPADTGAEYRVYVDGVQVGGTFTASADHASGQSDTVTLNGNWGPGQHTVSIDYFSDIWGGDAQHDRDLFLDEATYNGDTIAGAAFQMVNEWSPHGFEFTDTDTTGGGSSPGGTPMTATIGTGSDELIIKLTENEYLGSAQFTVSVDDVQIGGTLTASAERGSGQFDTVTVHGDWAAGEHTVKVDFVNDLWGGPSYETDRNLYVESATYNGDSVPGAYLEIANQSSDLDFTFTEAGSGGGGTDPNVWPEPVPDPNPDYTYPLKNDWNGIGDLVSRYHDFSGNWWAADDIVGIGWQPEPEIA